MARVTTKLTTALAGLALASLPAVLSAQSTTSDQPRPGSSHQQSRSADQNSPQYHLDQAKKVLSNINPSSVQGEARTQITELKRNFNQLENAWKNKSGNSARADSPHATGHTTGTAGTSGTTGSTTSSTTSEQTGTTSGTTSQTPRSDRASSMAGNDDWMRHYQAIDSTLDRLIGSASAGVSGSAGTTSGTPSATTGTTGSAGVSANVNIDAKLRSELTEFRRHLDRFHAAAMSQNQRMGEEDRASANPHSGVTGSMTGTAGTTGTVTSGTSGQTTSGTAGQATSSQTRTTASASGQVDSAAIARLTASIDELLRVTSTTGTAGTAGTTSSTTTGTASAQATVCVDRAKLEQLKRDIQALNRNNQQ